MNIPYEQEKSVKIESLIIYPCRGIMGIEVDAVKVSKYGIKYDREWSCFDKEKLGAITQAPEVKFTLLRQRIEKEYSTKNMYLIISVIPGHEDEQDKLPTKELRIQINKIPKGEIIDTGKVKGISEGPEADKWFSIFLGKPVVFMRSVEGFTKKLPREILKWSTVEDESKSFLSKAAIHIVNQASVRDLRSRVLAQYNEPEDIARIKIEAMPFRPNFIIDSKEAYSEDKMQEARIGNTLFRLVGYCSRCKAVANNYETCDRNPEMEPNPTLAKYRKHELGTLFGTYHQVDIIPSQQQFRRLFKGYPEVRDRKVDERYGIVKKGDELRIRVVEQRITF